MGGLHIAMNFLQVIGTHMAGSGLSEVWLESRTMGEGSIKKALEGKAYAKAIRGHKLTFQALWRIIYQQFIDYLDEQSFGDGQELRSIAEDPTELRKYLQEPTVLHQLNDFLAVRCEKNKNFALWWGYQDMVSTLLMFTRGIRSGDWISYRDSLPQMLPYMALYDHANYLKSLTVYLANMRQLPQEIETLFQKGDFGVLLSDHSFAQVDPDHAQEWLIGTCKSASGGILGITSDERSLHRWSLSLHWQGKIAKQTYLLFDLKTHSYYKEENENRRRTDSSDEDAIFHMLETLELLTYEESTVVSNIATRDKGTVKISDSLLSAHKRGGELVNEFVRQRLLKSPATDKTEISYHAPIPKNKALTLEHVHMEKPEVTSTVAKKTSRDFLHTLVSVYDAGRKIDLPEILKHELCDVPVSLANMSGELKSGDKAALLRELTRDLDCPATLSIVNAASVLIIDGSAFIITLGRPAYAKTFGNFATAFNERICRWGAKYSEVHILFDRYRPLSIKGATRKKRARGFAPVRRVIRNADVPLPTNMSTFLAMSENKTDLARFLSEEALKFNFEPLEVVLSGGFDEETDIRSSTGRDLTHLGATHEEADTRMILHAVNVDARNVVVAARDTDVALLLLYHLHRMKTKTCWLMGGTAKDRKYIPIHDIQKKVTPEQVKNILAFHAATGSDGTSKIASITKPTALKVFLGPACTLLSGLGELPLQHNALSNAEKFIVLLFKVGVEVETADAARSAMFGFVRQIELLPPTSDATRLHLERTHYQVCVWKNAHVARPVLPDPLECGWKVQEARLVAILMTLPPVPKARPELVTCKCKGACDTRSCGCRKQGVPCMKQCKCDKAKCVNFVEEDY